MATDEQKIDQTILALLYLTLHDGCKAWKSFDWRAMNRLHEKGLIEDPVNKAKSVVLTGKGLADAERLFKALFDKKFHPDQATEAKSIVGFWGNHLTNN